MSSSMDDQNSNLDEERRALDGAIGWRSDATAEPPEDLAAATIEAIVALPGQHATARVVPLRRPAPSRSTRRLWALTAAAACVAIAAGGTGYFLYQHAHEQAAREAYLQREKERKEAELAKQKAEFEEQQRRIVDLKDKLNSTTDPIEIERLKKQLEEETSTASRMRPGIRPQPGGPQKCQPGDPLCADL